MAAIIDWQSAAVRPLFETEMPEFISRTTGDLEYAQLPTDDSQQPDLPDNFDELSVTEKLKARVEVEQLVSIYRYLKLIYQLNPVLYPTFRLQQMEDLRRAIYYSSHSWSDGPPLLKSACYR